MLPFVRVGATGENRSASRRRLMRYPTVPIVMALAVGGVLFAYPTNPAGGNASQPGTRGSESAKPTVLVVANPVNPVMSGVMLTSISCPSASHCVAGGGTLTGGKLATGLSFFSTDGGSSWSRGTLPTGLRTGTFFSISCPTVSHCVAAYDAAGGNSDAEAGGVALLSTDGGASWSEEMSSSVSDFGTGFMAAISCPSASHCVAAGDDGSGGSLVSVSNDGGISWSTVSGVGPSFGLSCSTVTLCVGVSPASVSRDGGASWSNSYGQNLPGQSEISCFTISHCVTVGSSGLGPGGTYSTNGGQSWSAGTMPMSLSVSCSEEGRSGNCLNGIACPSVSLCTAVGTGGVSYGGIKSSPHGLAVFTRNGGVSWTEGLLPDGVGELESVTCPKIDRCVAVGSFGTLSSPSGAVLLSTNGGASWNGLNVHRPTTSAPRSANTAPTTTAQTRPSTQSTTPSGKLPAILQRLACSGPSVAQGVNCTVTNIKVSTADPSYVLFSVEATQNGQQLQGEGGVAHDSGGKWRIIGGPGTSMFWCTNPPLPAAVSSAWGFNDCG